jgi:hypothetical protein
MKAAPESPIDLTGASAQDVTRFLQVLYCR